MTCNAQRPKLSDPAHGTPRLQPRRSRRVRCSAWLGGVISISQINSGLKPPCNPADNAAKPAQKKDCNSSPANHSCDTRVMSVARRHLWRRVLVWKASEHRVVNEPTDQHEQTNSHQNAWPESFHGASHLTTQAQRPGTRDATIATATPPPGSLQRMVRPRFWCHTHTVCNSSGNIASSQMVTPVSRSLHSTSKASL